MKFFDFQRDRRILQTKFERLVKIISVTKINFPNVSSHSARRKIKKTNVNLIRRQ